MRALRVLLTFAVLCTAVFGEVYNFPAKSVNIGSAYTESFFSTTSLEAQITPATDAHAVHGIELADGSFVLTGKALEAEGSPNHEAFAVKLSATGAVVWGWKSGVSGQDASNAAAQLPNGEILVAGERTVTRVNCHTWLLTSRGIVNL